MIATDRQDKISKGILAGFQSPEEEEKKKLELAGNKLTKKITNLDSKDVHF